MTHRGEIVEKVVRRSAYPLTKLADKLNISRNTLYNSFKSANLNYCFIQEVGKIVHYDFSVDFSEIQKEEHARGEKNNELIRIEIKYSNLLEKRIKLLGLPVKVASQAEQYFLKQKLNELTEEIIQSKHNP
ncbi:MAG: helix-turn-helix domain-containing protein [Candidatus Amoebophilus sp.]